MRKENAIWKCDECGMVLETLHDCEKGCAPSCCGKPLRKLEPQSTDGAREKHIPVAQAATSGEGMKIRVGSLPHPMAPEHYIEWIEVLCGDCVARKYLKPGDAPEATFHLRLQPGMILRAYCNIHGLWTAKIE